MGELASTIVRVTAQPRLVSTGAAESVYLAGGGNRAPYRFGGVNYRAGLAQLPRFRAELDWQEDGWTGGVIPSSGVLDFAPSLATDYSTLSTAYFWNDAPITVEVGDEGQDGSVPATWATVLNGTIAGISAADGLIQFTIADLSKKLDKPLVTATFAGTGGIEGIADIAGRPKRRTWGQVFNVEARILDKVNSIWEFGDPAFQAASVQAVKDMGRAASPAPTVVAWQGSAAATFTALQGATAVQGSGVVAPSIQCLKWWTTPVGPLTVDFTGEATGSAPQLAASILTAFGQAFDTASRDAAHTARPDVAGMHIGDDRQTISQTLDQLLLGVSTAWVLDAGGAVYFRPITFSSPVETLTSLAVSRSKVFAPQRKRRVGFQRNHRQHSDGEIAASLVAGDVSGLGDLATQNNVYFNGPYLKEALGGVDATLANFKTSQGTAADFTGRGALATRNTADWDLGHIIGARRPESGATGGENWIINPNFNAPVRIADGGTWNIHASVTISGGQASVTNVNSAHVQPNYVDLGYGGPGRAPCSPGEKIYGSAVVRTNGSINNAWRLYVYFYDAGGAFIGSITQLLPVGALDTWVLKSGSVTAPANAAFFEAWFDTYFIDAQTLLLRNPRIAKTEINSTFGADVNSNIKDSANSNAVVAREALLTALGTAADFTGRGALATRNSVDRTETTLLTGFGPMAGLDRARLMAGSGGIADETNSYWVTNALAITSQGTAADFTGRGALATKNAVDLATADVLNKSLANVDSAANTKLGGVETNADVTSAITGPVNTDIQFNSDGTIVSGQLPKDLLFRLFKNGVEVTTGITWSLTILSGTITCTISGTGVGTLNITAFSATAVVRVKATVGSLVRVYDTKITKVVAAATGGGTGGGTQVSDSTITGTSATTYPTTPNGGPMVVKTGSTAKIDFTAPLAYERNTTALGSTTLYGKWQWRAIGGTWADVATEITAASASSTDGEGMTTPGDIAVTQSKTTGLAASTDYEVQLLLRGSNTVQTVITGTATATGG